MTDTSDLSARLGAALGDGYAVERSLGEGGFAVVFLVRDLALKRSLAVKVLSPDVITSKSMLERFRREAETVAQLSHPNIVPLHFIGQQDDLLYIAMQCVDGGSIADRLDAEKQLPVDDAVRITSEVASALAHAHRRGVVHRDIKPANVLVDAESGRCLVTDFGIARSADTATLTATGMVLGTPAYLAPEQVMGEPLDHRLDIFALGVMAYEMLAGRLPYEAASPTAAMMKRMAGPPASLVSVRAEIPEDVAAVVAKCLAIDPAERYQSAAEVVSALGGTGTTTAGRSTRAVMRPQRRSRRVLLRTVGVAAALMVVTVAWLTTQGKTAPPASREAVVVSAGMPTQRESARAAMVVVPSGDYAIGTDSGTAMARPRYVAHLKTFRIERTEVTVDAYAKFVAATRAPAPWGSATPDGRLPVTRVPWGDAANYCAWKYAEGGRLPSEGEWEAAARGASARPYPYGMHADAARANTKSAARSGPVPVGSFPRGSTPDGLQDMSGNVWEWTSSPMSAYPGAKPMADSMSQYRVIRGGAFDTTDSLATGWMRGYLRATTPPDQLPNTGFRCAMS